MIEAFRKEYGVTITQGWGMTEMSPLGTTSHLTKTMQDWPEARQLDVLAKAGQIAPNVEMKILDDQGRALPWDGKSVGELLVRGPAIVSAYYKNAEAAAAFTADGWFRTGDVATIDEDAFVNIADRTKDLIKSGGEWISSVALQNAAMTSPGVAEAAAVARPDEKWGERPVLFVSPRDPAAPLDTDAILGTIAQRFAKWQLPDLQDIRVVPEIPKTSVGKFDKKRLRELLHAGEPPGDR
jgi:fatty-acyl-CoA synthase